MGTPRAAAVSLERLLADGHDVVAVYTQPDRPAGRGNKLSISAVKQFAQDRGLAIFQPGMIRTAEAIEEFRSHAADVAVVVAYGRILPEAFLSAFPRGAINLHFSLLPKYRGAAPVNWAIVNGETETGVTTIQMDAGLDTGAILLQRATPMGATETSVELMDRLADLGADVLSETLASIDVLTPIPQNGADATLAPIMKKADGLIDWSMNANMIVDRVRGFQPFPTAYTSHRGGRLVIWSASVTEGRTGSPGEILEASVETLVVACGRGTALQITELQPEGKRRMSARDFLNGAKAVVGETLG